MHNMINTLYNHPLSEKTFYGIGGPADEIWEVDDVEAFADIWAETIAQNIPKVIIGKGSNTIFSDRGFKGRVLLPLFDKTLWKKNIVTVEVGKNFQTFIEETNKKGFEDLCNLSGIPGNVGGFIRGNAGALGTEIADTCIGVEYIDEYGQIQKRAAQDCEFGYRESIFKHRPDWCIVRATFALHVENRHACSLQKTKGTLQERWSKNPAGRSGGCLFKNPPGHIAGKLLDECGAKGDRIGDAEISEKHANFFLNKGKATQQDILVLAKKWKDIVKKEKSITLESEVFICDEYGKQINI